MTQRQIDQLSERQKELLTLVLSGTTKSKAIARETGLSPGSVDTMLSSAARLLGARDRTEAARLFNLTLLKSQEQSQLRSQGFFNWPKSAVSDWANATRRGALTVVTVGYELLKGPPLGGRKHRLRWDQITLQILRVALIGMGALTALVLLVLGFFETFGR